MRCMNSYMLNKNVFSLFLNAVSVMSGARWSLLAVQRENCSIHEVLGRRNCGRRSLFWCVEQSVGRSERIEDAGWQLLTSAHSM